MLICLISVRTPIGQFVCCVDMSKLLSKYTIGDRSVTAAFETKETITFFYLLKRLSSISGLFPPLKARNLSPQVIENTIGESLFNENAYSVKRAYKYRRSIFCFVLLKREGMELLAVVFAPYRMEEPKTSRLFHVSPFPLPFFSFDCSPNST